MITPESADYPRGRAEVSALDGPAGPDLGNTSHLDLTTVLIHPVSEPLRPPIRFNKTNQSLLVRDLQEELMTGLREPGQPTGPVIHPGGEPLQ